MSAPQPVAILVPVLRRPHRVAPLVETIAAVTPWHYRLLLIYSGDDHPERKACAAAARASERVRLVECGWPGGSPGDYPRKINEGVRASDEPLLFQGADDLLFHPGWLEEACRVLLPGIGVVGTNDLYNPRVLKGKHSTHSLVTRTYIEEFGTIDQPGVMLHEGYPHEYCDDEMVGTAIARGAYAHAHDAVVEHLHPYAGKGESDRVYDLGHSRHNEGMLLFRKRAIQWKHKATSSQFRSHREPPPPAVEPEQMKPRNPSIGVIVATHGHDQWRRLALKRAVPSVERQLRPNDTLTVLHVPDGTLHDARNRAAIVASENTPEWLVFLDADDMLDVGYLDAMRDAAPKHADAILVPAIYDQGRGPRKPETRPMAEVNRAVIGTAIRARLFFDLDGFRDWPVYEDWDLWLRALRAGARMIEVPGAVYRVFRSGRGRNRPGRVLAVRTYEAIRADLGLA